MANLKELVVNGVSHFISKVFINDSQINTINGVTVGSTPKFTDTVTTATTSGSGNAVTAVTASNGALTVTKGTTFLTSHQDISGKADKTATVSTVAYDSTNKKITKTINGTTSDVVTAATLKTAMNLNNVVSNLVDGSATGSVRGVGTVSENTSISYHDIFEDEDVSTTYVMGLYSLAEGLENAVTANASHVEGYQNMALNLEPDSENPYLNAGQHAEGIRTRTFTLGAHSEGIDTSSAGYGSHAEGEQTVALGDNSHAEGTYTCSEGMASHVEGTYTYTSGDFSHAEGDSSEAYGNNSHAEGWDTKSYGGSSHTEGLHTIARGFGAHAEGLKNPASQTAVGATGNYSHSEGNSTSATGESSHAEGDNTIASGIASHAEGGISQAISNYSHAEGYGTRASGNYSHAEGYSDASASNYNNTGSIGNNSHVEGNSTTASGVSSHAEGTCTIANHRSQHVFGEYNALDTSSELPVSRGNYVEIVGKGTADNARSNARTLDWSGNEVLAGKLTVGANPTANMDVVTKQYMENKGYLTLATLPIWNGTVT